MVSFKRGLWNSPSWNYVERKPMHLSRKIIIIAIDYKWHMTTLKLPINNRTSKWNNKTVHALRTCISECPINNVLFLRNKYLFQKNTKRKNTWKWCKNFVIEKKEIQADDILDNLRILSISKINLKL